MNLPSFLDRRFYFFVKEWDDICNLGRNECFEFFSLWILLHLPEDSSCRRYSFSREDNFLLNSENYATKIFRLFFVLECQGGWVRLNTTIYSYKMRGMRMDKSGYNLPYTMVQQLSIWLFKLSALDRILFANAVEELDTRLMPELSVALNPPHQVSEERLINSTPFMVKNLLRH